MRKYGGETIQGRGRREERAGGEKTGMGSNERKEKWGSDMR